MQDIEQPIFSRLMIDLGEMYGKHLSPLLVDMYWQALQGFELSLVRHAFESHVRHPEEGQFFPKPADVVRWIEGCPQGRALKAWACVECAMGRVGRYQSIAFDDPLIHRVIEDLGGWVMLCETALQDLPFRALDFQKRYRALLNHKERHPPYLVGIVERDNAKDGYVYPLPVLVGDPHQAKQVMVSGDHKRLLVQRSEQSVHELIQAIAEVQRKPEKPHD